MTNEGSIVRKLTLILLISFLAGCQSDEVPFDSTAESALEATAQEHIDDSPVASPVVVPEPARPVIEQNIAYGEAGNRNLVGYLTMPADVVEPQPGVLIIHEWWGLNDNIKAMARRIAGEGFVVLAVDLYDGVTAELPGEAQNLMAQVMGAPEATIDNVRQGIRYLSRYALAPRVASLGWCLGGTWSLQAAFSAGDELDAMVMYYGQVSTDEAQLETLDLPILGFFGGQDASIPLAEVQRFRTTLTRLGKDSQVRIYPDADHAFANPSGGNYNAEAATDAWERTMEFLNRTLRP